MGICDLGKKGFSKGEVLGGECPLGGPMRKFEVRYSCQKVTVPFISCRIS